MKKLLLLILVGSFLLLPLVGCNDAFAEGNTPLSSPPDENADATTPENTIEENTTPEITTPEETTTSEETTTPEETITPVEQTVSFEEVFGAPFMFFDAQPLIQDASIEKAQAEMRVEVLDYGIYLPNAVYSYATVVEDPTIVYPKEIVSATDKNRDAVMAVLTEIQNSESCYVLKNSISTSTKIAVYSIANVYYIVTFYEGDRVAKIHYIDENAELPPENNDVPAPNENGLFDNEEVTFYTKMLSSIPVSSWGGFEVKRTSNGEIYMNGALYENTGVFKTPNIVYDRAIIYQSFMDDALAELLVKIRNAESRYVLQTQDDNRYGKTFSIYYIDGMYCFLNEYNGRVTALWCEIANSETPPEVTPPVNTFVPAPNGEDPFGNVQTSFTAKTFAQEPFMSAWFSLEVEIDNDKIYLGKTLYKCVGIIENSTITYSKYLLEDLEDDENAEEKLEILEKIKNSQTCYLLKTDNEELISYSLYYIDGTYYFLNSISGKPSRIHYAATTTP